MKGMSGTLLAFVVILYSLIVLFSAQLRTDNTESSLMTARERVADVVMRFTFKQ